MSISMVKYSHNLFLKPYITKILGIPTYGALHQMQLDKKQRSFFHSNLEGATHGHLEILMTSTKYATLTNVPYVRLVHPGILIILNNATRVSLYKLKWV